MHNDPTSWDYGGGNPDQSGHRYSRGSLKLPEGHIAGAVGAGDAFCAGMLYGLHEGWDELDAAKFENVCHYAQQLRKLCRVLSKVL